MEQTTSVQDFCSDCSVRKNCVRPCKPVETWLRHGQSLVFEDKVGDVTVVFNQHNEVRFSELPAAMNQDESLVFADPIDKAQKTIPIKTNPCPHLE